MVVPLAGVVLVLLHNRAKVSSHSSHKAKGNRGKVVVVSFLSP